MQQIASLGMSINGGPGASKQKLKICIQNDNDYCMTLDLILLLVPSHQMVGSLKSIYFYALLNSATCNGSLKVEFLVFVQRHEDVLKLTLGTNVYDSHTTTEWLSFAELVAHFAP